jgi:hypothetical protein
MEEQEETGERQGLLDQAARVDKVRQDGFIVEVHLQDLTGLRGNQAGTDPKEQMDRPARL